MNSVFNGKAVSLDWPTRAIARLTLTRAGEMNTLSLELLDEFEAVLDLIDKPDTRALIVTGKDRVFCCGAHLRYFAGERAHLFTPFDARDKYLSRISRLFDRLEDLHFPTIAAVNGFALGGGCELALSCDMRVLADTAKLGLPETRLGAIAGAGGVQKLIRHVGRSKAMEWILRGSHIDAENAEHFGLAAAVVPAEEVQTVALNLAIELRGRAPRAIAQSKRSIYLSEDSDLRTAQHFGLEALSMLVGGEEWNEGMRAFIEKRPPAFDQW